MDFKDVIRARYSVRRFADRGVEAEKLALVLEAGRTAPTAANKQPQRILVIDGAGELGKVDGCTSCRFGAPVALLAAYDSRECWVRKFDGEDAGMVDCSIAVTQMMLQAVDLGLGSLWVMHFDPLKAREAFSIPAPLVPAAMLMLGYAAPDAAPSDRHELRFPQDKIILRGDFSSCL